MKDSTGTDKKMDRESINGLMDQPTTENGSRIKYQALVNMNG